jgi:hypothetical protein
MPSVMRRRKPTLKRGSKPATTRQRALRGAISEPAALAQPARAVGRMMHRLKTIQGHKLYGLHKQTVEPVFGIIKSAMRFRQLLLRGLDSVRGEWTLVTMAWNIKRMAAMAR